MKRYGELPPTDPMQAFFASGWLTANGCTVGEFGAKVAGLMNWWLDGIYHRGEEMRRAHWTNETRVSVVVGTCLSTYDASNLTRLVIAAHDLAIRLEIEGASPGRLRLIFTPRQREGDQFERHPTIEQAIAAVRGTP